MCESSERQHEIENTSALHYDEENPEADQDSAQRGGASALRANHDQPPQHHEYSEGQLHYAARPVMSCTLREPT